MVLVLIGVINKNMTKKELKQKTTYELQCLQESYKKIAIEHINEGYYVMAIQYLNRAEDIESILDCRKNGWDIQTF
jgi:hypothetical protein